MRILLGCPYSLSDPGGVQGQVLGLARALGRLGATATILGPCDGAPPGPGVRVVGGSLRFSANGSVAPIALAPAAARRTLAVLGDEAPDVVHLHEPLVPGPNQVAVMSGGLFGGRPTIGTFHASGRVPAYVYLRPFMRAMAGRLHIRTAVSPEARALAERWLGGSCRVLPNGVDVERFAKAEPWPGPRPAILFVGRHEPRKGLAVLLDAFARVRSRGIEADLWVAGDGPQTESLRCAGAPRTPGAETGPDGPVVWLGRISDDELARRMAGAAVFCAPSLHGESFGVVLLEAMAAATPVVASDISGYRDVARADREAILVPPDDAGALAQALERVLAGGALTDDLVEAGTARAAHFSMEHLAERYLDLYQSLLDRSP